LSFDSQAKIIDKPRLELQARCGLQKILHSARTEEAEVVETLDIYGGPNG
jgi:hypothetical protein